MVPTSCHFKSLEHIKCPNLPNQGPWVSQNRDEGNVVITHSTFCLAQILIRQPFMDTRDRSFIHGPC